MKKVLVIFIFFAITSFGYAQSENEDPIAQNVFPPELVMKYSYEIGLDDNQRTAIKAEIQKAQTKFLDLQWQVQAETQKMVQLLQAPSIDEANVLALADKVMDVEREVKKTHLSLLIRIKNILSQKQQARLMELRKSTK